MREVQSFIVRIYRRGAEGVAGVVEDVQTGCIHSFHSAIDLWAVVSTRSGSTTPDRSPK
jgi:hypothetical protein